MSTAATRQRSTRRNRWSPSSTKVAVLAGGRGTRLAPYTSILPKPLMPIGNRSILEIVVDQLSSRGFTNITFCVGYLSHLIRAVFDNGAKGKASIAYVQEEEALGTAGTLRLVEGIERTFIAMNGDVLTMLDYRNLVREHQASGNLLTIATHKRTIKADYGVLHLDGAKTRTVKRVVAYEEKPEIVSPVSMGIYVLEPEALDYIPEGTYFDFPDLVHALLANGELVGAYMYDGLWFDIGRQEDYERAVEAWSENGMAPEETDEMVRAR